MKMTVETLMKRDRTRLKNLLHNYRNEIITNIILKRPYEEPTNINEKVDNCIDFLNEGL